MKSQGRLVLIAIVCVDLLIVLAILAIRLINSRSANNLAQDTSVPEVSPGIVVSGSVRTPDGLAVENVAIYVKSTNNPPKLIATTNAAGNYRSEYYLIPGVEMVTVWAEKTGEVFQPETYDWRHPSGYEIKICDFLARPIQKIYIPIISDESVPK